ATYHWRSFEPGRFSGFRPCIKLYQINYSYALYIWAILFPLAERQREQVLRSAMDILDVLGGFGLYHVLTVFLVVLRAFPTAWTNMMTPIVAPDMDHWCARPEGAPSSIINMSADEWKSWAVPEFANRFSKCHLYRVFEDANGSWTVDRNQTLLCNRWEYDTSVYQSTIVNEWNLVCGRSYHRSVAQSVVMAGALVGVLLFGEMSDRLGRRPTFFTCVLVILVFGSLSSLAPGIGWYNAGRFVVAMGVAGSQATTVSLLMEIMPPQYRMMMNVGFGIGYTIPLLLLPLLAYYIRDWGYLQLATGLSALMMVPFWLACNYLSGRTPSLPCTRESKKATAFHFVDFFRTPKLRRNTLVLFALWFMGSFVYYNLVLSSTSAPGNPYFNYAISAASEIPAALLGLWVARRCSRRRSQALFLLLAALAIVPLPFLPKDSPGWLRIGSNVLVRFLALNAGFIKWIMALEVFPTLARSFGFACVLTCSRFGAMVAPFLRDLGEATDPSVPYVIQALFLLLASGISLLLPETLNKPLPDTFHEAESISR
ncbi:organic cation transporter protein-like, partial [Amblyomma americanum]